MEDMNEEMRFLQENSSFYGYNERLDDMIETEFTRLKDTVYLDHAGATQYAKSQIEHYQQDLLSNVYGNPHSRNHSSRLATDTIDQVRFRILQFFNTTPDEYSVIFTSGCTAALKLVAESFDFFPEKGEDRNTQKLLNAYNRQNRQDNGEKSNNCENENVSETYRSETDRHVIGRKTVEARHGDMHHDIIGFKRERRRDIGTEKPGIACNEFEPETRKFSEVEQIGAKGQGGENQKGILKHGFHGNRENGVTDEVDNDLQMASHGQLDEGDEKVSQELQNLDCHSRIPNVQTGHLEAHTKVQSNTLLGAQGQLAKEQIEILQHDIIDDPEGISAKAKFGQEFRNGHCQFQTDETVHKAASISATTHLENKCHEKQNWVIAKKASKKITSAIEINKDQFNQNEKETNNKIAEGISVAVTNQQFDTSLQYIEGSVDIGDVSDKDVDPGMKITGNVCFSEQNSDIDCRTQVTPNDEKTNSENSAANRKVRDGLDRLVENLKQSERSLKKEVDLSTKSAHYPPRTDEVNEEYLAQESLTYKEAVQRSNHSTMKQSVLCYLDQNHTSVIGMREIAVQKKVNILSLSIHDIFHFSEDKSAVQLPTRQLLHSCHDSGSQGNGCHTNKTAVELPTQQLLHSRHGNGSQGNGTHVNNSLFIFPGQCNFSGRKFPLEWIEDVKDNKLAFQYLYPGTWFTLLDAASLVSTSPLDLTQHKPDFVALSFYKIFGFPTGLGALLVKNESCHVLNKTYFGGGTVQVALAQQRFHVNHSSISERFEDGTVSFLDIIALRHGFDTLQKWTGNMYAISNHTFSLARYVHRQLLSYHHGNGALVARVYSDTDYEDVTMQGGIISFNLLRANGDYVGFAEVDKLAQLHDIHLRTGCFCNLGACQHYLGMTTQQIIKNFKVGHKCGDEMDLIDGLPTGAVRISFGYMSTFNDAWKFLDFIKECFVEGQLVMRPIGSKNKCATSEDVIPLPVLHKLDKSLPCTSEAIHVSHNETTQTETIPLVKFKPFRQGDGSGAMSGAKTQRTCDEYEHYHTGANTSEDSAVTQNLKSKPDSQLDKCRRQRKLSRIFIYPVKSCAAFEVNSWEIGPCGLLYDRDWMIVGESGIALSQKRETKLCLIKPVIDLNKRLLTLSYPGRSSISVPLDVTEGRASLTSSLCQNMKVCGDRVQGLDCGGEVANWLSSSLERQGLRLMQQNREQVRLCKLKDVTYSQSQLSLVNESQFLLLSIPSVQALMNQIRARQQQLGEDSETDLDLETNIHRFRTNFVTNGGEAFEEDTYSRVRIGKLVLTSQGQCSRCQMICVNQSTGQRSKEPLKTLATFRGRKIPFGIHLKYNTDLSKGHVITVGDTVEEI